MPLHHPALAPPTSGHSPRDFFEQTCARLLEARPAVARALGGLFAFQISGPMGGTWALDLDRSQLTSEIDRRPRLLICASDTVFEAWLGGRLDFQSAEAR